MKCIYRFILLVFLLGSAVPGELYGQKEGNNWTFGERVQLDFNAGTDPVVKIIPFFNTYEAISTISDEQGNLLLYTGLATIRNGQHAILGGIRGRSTMTQAALMLRQNDSTYWTFYGADIRGISGRSLAYAEVHIGKNGRKDSLISIERPLVDSISEKLTCVRHANGRDWWILTHGLLNDKFVIMLFGEGGIEQIKAQSIGSNYIRNGKTSAGEMTFNPTGSLLAVTGISGLLELFDFDRCEGILSDPRTIVQISDSNYVFYGASFSPSGRYLYVTAEINVIPKLFQYDMEAADILASEVEIFTVNPSDLGLTTLGQLELGPNGKIYAVHWSLDAPNSYSTLGVVHSPDNPGLACDFRPYSLNIAPGKTDGGLPNMPNFKLGAYKFQHAHAGLDREICPGQGTQIGTPDTTGNLVYTWVPELGLDDPHAAQPVASPGVTTRYVVVASDTSLNAACATSTDTVVVTVLAACPEPEPLPGLEIPNVVTPNADGFNDRFEIPFLPEETAVEIFDRWGRVVFRSGNYDNSWPDSQVLAGVYFYTLRLKDRAAEVGTVTVLR